MSRIICALADVVRIAVGTNFDRQCSLCDARVALSPSGQRLLANQPQLEIICARCYEPDPDEVPRLADDLPEIMKEVAESVPNLRRTRN